MAEGIYQEAADTIINADRAAAEDVATRALAEGIAPGDIMHYAKIDRVENVIRPYLEALL